MRHKSSPALYLGNVLPPVGPILKQEVHNMMNLNIWVLTSSVHVSVKCP
jgi:hypothetical protein